MSAFRSYNNLPSPLSEFMVKLVSRPGAKLGVEFDILEEGRLRVIGVRAGIVQDYNTQASSDVSIDREVREGDYVRTPVTLGIANDPKALEEHLRKNGHLVLIVTRPTEFTVEVKKPDAACPLGIDIKKDADTKCVLITKVIPGGPMDATDPAIQSMDRIVEVNGKRGNSRVLLKAMKKVEKVGDDGFLRLILDRPTAGPASGVDVSGLTRLARDDKGLFRQPDRPPFKVALVQVYIRSQEFGGSDKSASGHRYDSVAIANGLIASGVSCQLIHYLHEEHSSFIEVCQGFDALVVRCTSGQILADGGDPMAFDVALRNLQDLGVHIWPSPDVRDQMSAKSALVKIRNLRIGLEDTNAYLTPKTFEKGFKKTLAFQPRMIMQSSGSADDAVWIVKLKLGNYCHHYGQRSCSDSEVVVLLDARSNREEEHTVGEFIEFCINGITPKAGVWATKDTGKYLSDQGHGRGRGQLVDQRFCPRVAEGGMRYVMVGEETVGVLQKRPAKDSSVALTGGSNLPALTYSRLDPSESPCEALTKHSLRHDMKYLLEALDLDGEAMPILWTIDFVNVSPVGTPENQERWAASEFNCACVGIPSLLPACCTKESPSACVDCVPPEDRMDAMNLTNAMGRAALDIMLLGKDDELTEDDRAAGC
jgi:hypothetical protein